MSETINTENTDSEKSPAVNKWVGSPRARLVNFYLMAILLHIPVFVYPILRLSHWLELGTLLTAFILIPLTGSQIFSRVFLRNRKQAWANILRRASDLWLGVSALVLTTLVCFECLAYHRSALCQLQGPPLDERPHREPSAVPLDLRLHWWRDVPGFRGTLAHT